MIRTTLRAEMCSFLSAISARFHLSDDMFVEHPDLKVKQIFNVLRYADIRCCSKNPTHVDFYINPQAEGERGAPDFVLEFETEEERDSWFGLLKSALYNNTCLMYLSK